MNFSLDRYYYSGSVLYRFLNRKWLTEILRIASIFGYIALPVYILSLYSVSFALGISGLLSLAAMLGLISFPIYIFITKYLPSLELRNINNNQKEAQNAYLGLDLESAYLVGKNLERPSSLLADLAKTFYGAFFAKEIDGDINELYSGVMGGISPVSMAQIINAASSYAVSRGRVKIYPGDILFALFRESVDIKKTLVNFGLSLEDIQNLCYWTNSIYLRRTFQPSLTTKLKNQSTGFAEGWSSGYTNTLDRFSYEMTSSAGFGSFSVSGREDLLDEMENVLTKERKSSCILVGGLGVGKSTLVSGLAEKVFWGGVSSRLAHQRVLKFDVSTVISSAQTPAELEQILTTCFNEAVTAGNIILFIDDIHTIFSGGKKTGTLDASQIIAPYLENSHLRIIGATTEGYFQTYIESKAAIAGNFTKIKVEPTTEAQTMMILEDVTSHLGSKYHLTISYNALKEIYRVSEKYTVGKEFPAKAVDLLEELCSAARNYSVKRIDTSVVDRLAGKIMQVPLEEAEGSEKEKLINLEKSIHGKVIGQDMAVKSVSDALRRARTEVRSSKKPIGSFLFLGPTGVGKTELAKALADEYFGSEDSMVRMDMSEFQTVESMERFIGKKISGEEVLEGGDLVKKVRSKPFSLILLDEIEKAHPNVLNLFLQVLDEGYLTDGAGEKVIFTNTILIATSNAGANVIRNNIASSKEYDSIKKEVLDYLQENNIYRPEFLNRFDGVILFKPLSNEDLLSVSNLMFTGIKKDFEARGYLIDLEPGLIERLAQDGYEPEYGARPMRRVFQDKLESFLAEKILKEEIKKDQQYIVKASDIYN